MKDFVIDIVVTGNEAQSTALAQASGTLSSRPLIKKTLTRKPMACTAFTCLLASIEDLSRFLHDGDNVDVFLYCSQNKVADWICKGSGDSLLDNKVRQTVQSLSKEGISVSIVPATQPRADLVQKAALSAALGM